MGRGILLAAVTAAVLSGPATASATTRVVDQQAGPYTTITDAILAADPGDVIDVRQGHYDEELWVAEDDITIRGEPGAIVSETAPFVVSLMGARDRVEGLTIAGAAGGVRIAGDQARITRTTITAATGAVSITGAVLTGLDRVRLRATALDGVALVARNDAPDAQVTQLDTAIVTGGRMGAGLDLASGAVGDTAAVGALRLHARFTTVAGAPTALRTARAGRGADPEAGADYSIVHGAARGLGTLLTDLVDADAPAFVDASALDFHLRESAWAASVILSGHPSTRPAPTTDYDGVARGARPSAGAFQFVEHAPRAALSAATATVRQGVPATFDASGSADPDPGGRILAYTWDFGDGHQQTTGEATVAHVFDRPGRASVTVRVEDQLGEGATSDRLAMTVTDALAPVVRVTSPRDGSTRRPLRRSGRRRVISVVKVAGRATDASSGVARVDVTLRRATRTYASKAALDRAGAFAWHSPARARLARGRWTLTVRATDRAGNASASVLHFTVT